jgi:hypothetical protein
MNNLLIKYIDSKLIDYLSRKYIDSKLIIYMFLSIVSSAIKIIAFKTKQYIDIKTFNNSISFFRCNAGHVCYLV